MAELFRINAVNADEIAALFDQAPTIAAEELERGMLETTLLLERETKDAAPTASNALRSSISQSVNVLNGNVLGVVGTSIGHAVPVELGTKPHFPPLEPLRDWVRDKLNVPETQVKSVAFLIGRKIAREGTDPNPFFKEAFEANKKQVETIFIRAQQRIRNRLANA